MSNVKGYPLSLASKQTGGSNPGGSIKFLVDKKIKKLTEGIKKIGESNEERKEGGGRE